MCFAGCSGGSADSTSIHRVIGGPGTIDGTFVTVRGAAYDPSGRFIYAVDRTGRIQKFSADGTWLKTWSTPDSTHGKPTTITVDSHGIVWVADTHYSQLLKYSSDGELLAKIPCVGYPTGLQVAEDGTIYVSEFGGNDRVQVFDKDGKLLRSWGSFGEGPDQFRRPQALALWHDKLYVADSINHRVVVYDLQGKRLSMFGGYGSGPGELKYPFGIAVVNGSVYVGEYGNHRVQRFTEEGRPVAAYGTPGVEPGQLNMPWSVAGGPGGTLIVCDAGNHRLQLWSLDQIVRKGAD
jgi:DNA-binding beta-propeller fold protein YncE